MSHGGTITTSLWPYIIALMLMIIIALIVGMNIIELDTGSILIFWVGTITFMVYMARDRQT